MALGVVRITDTMGVLTQDMGVDAQRHFRVGVTETPASSRVVERPSTVSFLEVM
jgi:hypothetical protein